MRASAAVGAAGAGLVLAAVPAAASAGSTVTPSTGLHDGQTVAVLADSGSASFPTSPQPQVLECPNDAVDVYVDCSFLGPISFNPTVSATRGEVTFTGSVKVYKRVGSTDQITCKNQCVLVALTPALVGTTVPLTFK